MKTLDEIIADLEKHKDRIKKKYKVSRFGVFGSFSRNEQEEDDYIDIMVEFKGPVGLEFVDLSTELEEILNHKVHLIPKSGIQNTYLKKVRKDIIYI